MSFLKFPSKFQRFIRVPIDYVYEALSQTTNSICETEPDGKMVFKMRISRVTGIKLRLRVFPEGDASSLEFNFNYLFLALTILMVLAISLGLSLLLSSVFPLFGVLVIPILVYRASFEAENFLSDLGSILRGLEVEYARRKLVEDRIRWQQSPKNVEDLYRRLCEKHIKVWGKTYALEYKISEYQKQGLTREEAIRKVADEEGIF